MTLLTAIDVLGHTRTISCSEAMISGNPARLMQCNDFNVCTYDFRRGTDERNRWSPRDCVTNPPTPWDRVGVSAHANTLEVVNFLRDELEHDGLDDNGMMYSSFVHYNGDYSDCGAFYFPAWNIFVYCHEDVGGQDFYFASGISIVAHEIFHGITKYVCGLHSECEPGALNESYSDIFGVILANRGETDIKQWNWEIGIPSGVTNSFPIRDLSDPEKFHQPAHYDHYQEKEILDDQGGVHTNNGIHNKAAYNLLISKDSEGYLFDANSAGYLFYSALRKFSRHSKFIDSKRNLITEAKNCFPDEKKHRAVVFAINKAFGDVGI
jgi:Zn-dependent metalloprotease